MNPATVQKPAHPQYITFFSTQEERKDSIKLNSVDRMWSFFKVLPNHSPRLDKANGVAQRMDARCTSAYLPSRRAFQTTVDYYEAALPLGMARNRFKAYFVQDDCMRGVHRALASILPRLF